MGWSNPGVSWKELERRLSGRPPTDPHGDAPISRRKRRARVEITPPSGPVVPYVELHAHSSFSFLDGASDPAALVAEAVRQGLTGLALTDHDGFYGAPLFAEAAAGANRQFSAEAAAGGGFETVASATSSTTVGSGAAGGGFETVASATSSTTVGSGAAGGGFETVASATSSTTGGPTSSTTGGRPTAFQTVYGAELSLGLPGPQQGVPDPVGEHLLVLARGVEGYHRLAGAITEAQLRGDEKGRPLYDLDELVDRGRGHWLVLTGCRKGFRTRPRIERLVDWFGADSVAVELTDHGHPTDSRDNDVLAGVAAELRLPVVATGNVHYATPERHRLADAMAAVRARRSLGEIAGWLPAGPAAYLRSGEEMARRFHRFPGAVARSLELAAPCAFDLQKARPRLPKRGIPAGHSAASWLRELVEQGFAERYAAAYSHDPRFLERARVRVAHELEVIERKDFPGYFVIVHDIVAFARSQGILCQGRGSAAASAVCYALGITAIDPVYYRLPFERFISEHREEEPDIDVDFDSDRREEVIQWVYDTYGRRNAAQVANIVGYRPKMAVRDAAKALGHSPGQQDAWSKTVSSWTTVEGDGVPEPVLALAREFLGAPRHLGIHSGGMVLTEEPIGEVVPIERARMEKRTVLQWDKDGCEFMGLVKFDLLGLGMLSALDHMLSLAREHCGDDWTLATIPKEEPAVYDMLCRADSIGVFQVESRAQIGTLPRLQPRCFYDLAIEIALIRPGPIQGGAVHPYVRRATGRDPVDYPHPMLEPVLERTKGVPLFQEQLMEMGRVLGDFSADDADLLRRAMGSKRGIERIESLKEQLMTGMRAKGLSDETARAIYVQILSFANFGFAESHALSFAKLVYASSWFKLHYPAAFLAGLLRAQPMGFYSPQSLVQDARRHGVEVRGPSLALSEAQASLEPMVVTQGSLGFETVASATSSTTGAAGGGFETVASATSSTTGAAGGGFETVASATSSTTAAGEACFRDGPAEPTPWVPGTPDPTPHHRRDGAYAVRLGLDSVRGIGADVAKRIVAARAERPFGDVLDLSRRAGLESRQLEALATAGALEFAGREGPEDRPETPDRRRALWAAGWSESAEQLEGLQVAAPAPELPEMTAVETMLADLWATGMTPGDHPFAHLRGSLAAAGIPSVGSLATLEPGRRLTVAGLVTHRQRPGTAGGVTFLNLEDESGMVNVICTAGLWRRYRKVAAATSVMLVRGVLERNDGVTNLVADRLAPLAELLPSAGEAIEARHRSRDFR